MAHIESALSEFNPPESIPSAKGSAQSYVVRITGEPAVSYEGDVAGYRATRPAPGQRINSRSATVRRYVSHLKSRHDNVAGSVGATKFYSYAYSFNGFAAALSPGQVRALKARSDVLSVEVDTRHYPTTETSPTFLGLNAEGGLWDQLGGTGAAGEDVIIGVIDTGIWPEHPSFSDQEDFADRTGSSGKRTRVYGPPPAHWNGSCQSGELFSQDDCNNKLIGARYFLDGFNQSGIVTQDYISARDADGHGTHTASTAGGNHGVEADVGGSALGPISGVAPRARIAAYKACWNDEGCAGTDLLAAIDQAVADGVDVINYSIGSDAAGLFSDGIAFLYAADAGVFVATSAGNAGPGAGPVGSPAVLPWVTSVGASTHGRSFQATVTLGNGDSYTGATMVGGLPDTAMVDAADAGDELCAVGALNPAVVSGKLVLCKRGLYARVDKSRAVLVAGGAGMILYNANAADGTAADAHFLPSVHVDLASGLAIKDYIANNTAPTGSISDVATNTDSNSPYMADFSSRGENLFSGDLIKPDVTAPGVSIVAGMTPTPFFGLPGALFGSLSGTSMSSPHVAGLGALLRQQHPDWSPEAIKSAIMGSAHQDVRKEDGVTLADPFDIGAGHIAPNAAAAATVVHDAGFFDYLAFLCGASDAVSAGNCAFLASIGFDLDPSALNVPSIGVGALAGYESVSRTLTNTGATGVSYTASIEAPAGVTVTVSPTNLVVDPGASATYTVTFTNVSAPLNTWAFGGLTWSDGATSVRVPFALRPVGVAAPEAVNGSGISGAGSFDVTFGATGAFDVITHGLVAAATQSGNVVDDPSNDINTALDTGVGYTLHFVYVAPGTEHLRVALFDDYTDGDDDLDLYVFGPAGNFVAGSGSPTSAEQVDVTSPAAGWWFVVVHGWQTDGADANYTLFSWTPDPDLGNVTVTAPATATIGDTGTVGYSWSGLDADEHYLGAFTYTIGGVDAQATTIIEVDTH